MAFVDSDVKLPSSWLETCIKQIQSNDQVLCVSACVQPDGYLSHFSEFFDLPSIPKRPTNNINGSNMFYKTTIIRELGGFDVGMRDGEDTDLGYRLLRRGFKIHFVDNLMCKHHVQPSIKSLMRRSFSHGRAGTLLFFRYRKPKLQDIAFLALLTLLLISVIFWIFTGPRSLIWLSLFGLLMLLVGGMLFSISNFDLAKKKRVLPLLTIVSSLFLLIHLSGRLANTPSALLHTKVKTKPLRNP